MFCPECLVEYDEDEENLTHCPVCGTFLISSAFEDPIIDEAEIDCDDFEDE